MPLHWTISHDEKRVIVRTEGEIRLEDVEAYLDDVVTQDAMAYGKLFDATDGSPAMSDHDLMMLGARIRAYASTLRAGPLAIVVTMPAARAIADRFANLATAERPIAILETVDEAQRWLEGHR